MLEKHFCPVCEISTTEPKSLDHGMTLFDCRQCGVFEFTEDALSQLTQHGTLCHEQRSAIGCCLQDQQRYSSRPIIDSALIEKLLAIRSLPTLDTQIENFIKLLGERSNALGVRAHLRSTDLYRVGSPSSESLLAIAQYLHDNGKIGTIEQERELLDFKSGEVVKTALRLDLTVSGWLDFEKIKRGHTVGRQAFMAMPFSKPDLNDIWLPALRDAVAETGFLLKRVDEIPKPGLIDLHMREQIRQARFLVVELTYSNLGSYWEAGYAEGLGKPVYYTCRIDEPVHFDVAHSYRIKWDPSNLVPALKEIKAAIRLNLPEARQEEQSEQQNN